MNPRARRIIVPLVVLGIAAGVVTSVVLTPQKSRPATDSAESEQALNDSNDPQESSSSEPTSTDDVVTNIAEQETTDAPTAPVESLGKLRAVAPAAPDTPIPGAGVLGSLDPRVAKLYIELTTIGAGIEKITLSEHWQTAADSRHAAAHYAALKLGDPSPPPLPAESQRYILQTTQTFRWTANGQLQQKDIPVLSADAVVINGYTVRLNQAKSVWTETAPGRFETAIFDENDELLADIVRQFVYDGGYDLTLQQRIINRTDEPFDVKWIQYGPGDLRPDRSAYIDRRRARVGYLALPLFDPNVIKSDDNDLLFERDKLLKRGKKAGDASANGDTARVNELLTIWPNETSREKGYVLSWYGSANRYFTITVHAALDETAAGSKSLEDVVNEVRLQVSPTTDPKKKLIFIGLRSKLRTIAPGEETAFDLGVYAGPLKREILFEEEPYKSLAMDGLILYQMSAFCAICTFKWLANFLIQFLTVVHGITFDWGISIIILVCLVRILLHPLTKKAQINMQRFGKVMGDLKPEIDKLQKKYKDQPKKLQTEQMRLMRERGANPLQLLGCLPMFLQMPIWVALYAMLYFAFELRHEPALWGFFQLFWEWPFLADLSSADHFFWQFATPTKFLLWNLTGINLLPILMGVVFYIQQKYMSPPPSPSTTKEQLQQQKMMKIMMVVLFPLMLYSAPSGLTLYIFTSTLIGIIESRYVRKHIKEMDLTPKKKPDAKGKPKDAQGRAFTDAVARAKAKRKPPAKKFKKR